MTPEVQFVSHCGTKCIEIIGPKLALCCNDCDIGRLQNVSYIVGFRNILHAALF